MTHKALCDMLPDPPTIVSHHWPLNIPCWARASLSLASLPDALSLLLVVSLALYSHCHELTVHHLSSVHSP